MRRSLFVLAVLTGVAGAQPAPQRYKPAWGNGELELARLPAGMWTLHERHDGFELVATDTGARVDVKRDVCSLFYATPPAGAVRDDIRVLNTRVIVEDGPPWIARGCIEILGVEATVTITLPAAPTPEVTNALSTTFTPIENPNEEKFEFMGALAIAKDALGMVSDGWLRQGPLSSVSQIDFLYAGGNDGQLQMFRIAAGLGSWVEHDTLRAAAHLGFGIETAPMKRRTGEDHTGGSLFLDLRARKTMGKVFAQVSGRGTWYFDMDCRDDDDDDDGGPSWCGDRYPEDFAPEWGWEAELRLGFMRSTGKQPLMGGFLGARYFGIQATDRVEHNALVALGYTL